jgi:hypothetical protein
MKNLLRKFLPPWLLPSSVFERYVRTLTDGGNRVCRGPFRGIELGPLSYSSPIASKLLGLYEYELHAVIEEVLEMPPSLVVDVGAAEGYYACGLASRCPVSTKHVAFEADFRFRFALRQNLVRNGLGDRVQVRGLCGPEELSAILAACPGAAFVLCDTEGAECELVDPMLLPSLRRAVILVELHEFAVPGVGEYLKSRLSATHTVREIESKPRTRKDLCRMNAPRAIQALPSSTIRHYLNERPPGQNWLFAKPSFPASERT